MMIKKKKLNLGYLCLTDEKLERAFRKMFSMGEAWAVTYTTWFSPSKEDTEAKVKSAVRKARRIVKSSKRREAEGG